MQTALENSSSIPALVVSVHDVSPVTRKSVERMLSDLARVGVSRTSLLVIPDHHHQGNIAADPDFSAWLRDAAGNGHEAVLHGYYHLRPSKGNEGFVTRAMTRTYTAGEGEFYDLSFDEASVVLEKGRDAMERSGVTPVGFIAPAWLLGKEAEQAVRSMGFCYTTRIDTVIDNTTAQTHEARSMVYSVRAPWRRVLSLAWNEFLFHRLRKAPLLRIGLHPPDWEYEAIRRHILKCVRMAASERSVTTYRDWLDLSRSSVQ